MKRSFYTKMPRLFLSGVIIFSIIGSISMLGIIFSNELASFNKFIQAHRYSFTLWRWLLYVGIGVGWWHTRKKLIQVYPAEYQSLNRMLCITILIAIFVEIKNSLIMLGVFL